MRATPNPQAHEKMMKLKAIPVDQIRKFPAIIVDCTIGDLSLKDSHRTIYVMGSTLTQIREQTNKMSDIFQEVEKNIKNIIEKCEQQDENNVISEGEIIQMLKEAISPELIIKKIEKAKEEMKKIKDEKAQTEKNI